jgi:hypothetical protein
MHTHMHTHTHTHTHSTSACGRLGSCHVEVEFSHFFFSSKVEHFNSRLGNNALYLFSAQLFNLTSPTRRRATRVVQVDAPGEDGMSALHTAALLGLAPTCRLLIHLGANRYTCNADGATPADVARRAGYDR